MKIFHILLGKANPNTMNGVNKVVDAFATEQTLLGYDVTVCGVANNLKVRHEHNYGYQLFVACKNPFKYPKELLAFLLRNSDENSIFHFHSVFILWYYPLIKILKKNGRRHIFLTPHGAYIPTAMNSIKKKIGFWLFDSKIIQNVEAVHIIGYQTENNDFVKKYAKRIVVIPNGFGVQNIPEFKGDKDDTLVFGYLGRLAKRHKGLDELIHAFAEYKRQGGKGILNLAGGGPDEDFLKRLTKEEKMLDYIRFEGVVYDESKWGFLHSISALISPSRWDGLPTACLEAAAAGRPLVVTADTNLGIYVEKYGAGIVIPHTDKDAIVQQMFDFENVFYDEDAYQTMCEAAKRMVREELNWKSITKQIVEKLYGREISRI